MIRHPVLQAGRVAVITGAADGIGLAMARHLHGLGLSVVLADIQEEPLEAAAADLEGALATVTDVSSADSVQALCDQAYAELGQVDLLMNNAGTGGRCTSWAEQDVWRRTIEVNLWGVLHGVHTFVPRMLEQGTPGLVINTGSKQGITTPPGNPAYNVSKAGIKAATEALQHEFREAEGCQLSAHLLVPGFTYTGMIRRFVPEKPAAAWTPEQVVEFALESIERGDFYILCPDNDVSREVDNRRMAWAMGDLIENRPPLSRWHPEYEAAFRAFVGDE